MTEIDTQKPKVMGTPHSAGIGTRQNIKVIDRATYGGITVEIMEYQKLLGASNLGQVQTMWFMEQQNVKVRQIAVYINQDAVRIEAGAMSYFKGNLEMVSGVDIGNVVGKWVKAAVTKETMSQPIYTGTGMLVLEPSFKHYIPFTLNEGESVIVDKSMFYVASASVDVRPVMQKSISAGLMGGEGWFQTQITGPGLVVLESVVPLCEIDITELHNETLRVDGSFAVLRSAGLSFTVERSAKTLIGSAISGEGLVNVFRGTGNVWLAPTLKVYNVLGSHTDVRYMNMNTSKG